MKKTLLILISTVAALAVYGQGGFTLDNNNDGNLITIAISPPASINPGNSGNFLGSDYSYGFIWGNGTLASTSLLVNSWTGQADTPNPTFGDSGSATGSDNSADQGLFFANGEVILNNAVGSLITIEILAWYNGGGTYTTFAQAAAAGVNTGVSGLITGVALASGTGFPSDAYYVPAFTVQSPEPSTMVLAGLGAAAMLLFRRRQS
jgi:hypothetical protein